MRPYEPFLTLPRYPSPAEPEPALAAGSGHADSLLARVIAVGVLCAAVASIVGYVLEAVLAL